jgi:hypothetical protein
MIAIDLGKEGRSAIAVAALLSRPWDCKALSHSRKREDDINNNVGLLAAP